MGAHGLGRHVVGQRVVVRRRVHGELGPTGGPAFTDVLGVCEVWPDAPDGDVVVRTATGEVATFPRRDIVSGKPVPPRPSTRLRATAVELQRRVTSMWTGLEIEYVGEWLLLTNPTSPRQDIAMAIGDPGLPLGDAVRRISDSDRTRVRVLADGPEQDAFVAAGWRPADEPLAALYVAGISRAIRTHGAGSANREDDTFSDGDSRVTATLDGDWLGLNAFTPGNRADSVLLSALSAGAEQGTLNAFVGVHVDAPVVEVLEGLGFVEHHRYRYVVR